MCWAALCQYSTCLAAGVMNRHAAQACCLCVHACCRQLALQLSALPPCLVAGSSMAGSSRQTYKPACVPPLASQHQRISECTVGTRVCPCPHTPEDSGCLGCVAQPDVQRHGRRVMRGVQLQSKVGHDVCLTQEAWMGRVRGQGPRLVPTPQSPDTSRNGRGMQPLGR
jgi:hypothetical protein